MAGKEGNPSYDDGGRMHEGFLLTLFLVFQGMKGSDVSSQCENIREDGKSSIKKGEIKSLCRHSSKTQNTQLVHSIAHSSSSTCQRMSRRSVLS